MLFVREDDRLRLWSVSEIMRIFNSTTFLGLVVHLGETEHVFDVKRQSGNGTLNSQELELVMAQLGGAEQVCGEIGFRAAKSKAAVGHPANLDVQGLVF